MPVFSCSRQQIQIQKKACKKQAFQQMFCLPCFVRALFDIGVQTDDISTDYKIMNLNFNEFFDQLEQLL